MLALKARSVGRSLLSIPAYSQIANIDASGNNHSMRDAGFIASSHNVSMDKNGGPNHLQAWREFRKLSQAALADAVDTTASVISMLESGDRGLSAKWLRRLAPALDTTPGMLLDHDPRDLDTDVLEIWVSAGKREQRQITEIAKTIVRDGTDG